MAIKRLYRSIKDRKIAGVCAGLAEYFNIDPAIVRIIFLFSALVWGASIILYIIFWICVPNKDAVGKK
ncbi:MAG: PspC domain-containing protein [Candidatus Omnitrophica bacterium]|nr:PspC domain-containing protein [Candidatus Omnitrophota bacterium]MDD5352680.1 PspC domain-containing protein [Candidatus Omnitrophota bacterium]MDD5550279.1 PspC domain-containing protein [Candidatus Omnitrophota bacterium]